MSVISIQVGQCGNQIGSAFYNKLYEEALTKSPALSNAILNTFFNVDNQKVVANAVLIDMEPKVVNACLSQRKPWYYDSSSVFCQQEGSGNNWAFGYNIHGVKWRETILDKIRKHIEKTDVLKCVAVCLSLAGGTGSGVGTSIVETVREEFDVNLLNIAVWPYSFGEVILQNYNTALTVSHIASTADSMLIIQNDWLHSTAVNCLNEPKPDFNHLNSLCASVLTSAFVPIISNPSLSCSQYGENPLDSLFHSVSSQAGYPFCSVVTTPITGAGSADFSIETWPGITKRCVQMAMSNTQEPSINWNINSRSENRNKIISAIGILRGSAAESADLSILRNALEPRYSSQYSQYITECPLEKYEKRMSVIMNSQAILNNLDTLIEKTHRMSRSGAYLHHYNKFGIENEHIFEFAFPYLEQLVYNYSNISNTY
jgi:tubulin delta